MLTVTGFGFGANSTVTVGGQPCHVVHASDTELKCRTPAVSGHSAGVLHTDEIFLEEGLYFLALFNLVSESVECTLCFSVHFT